VLGGSAEPSCDRAPAAGADLLAQGAVVARARDESGVVVVGRVQFRRRQTHGYRLALGIGSGTVMVCTAWWR
jgi:hypothetical protein